MSDTTLRPPLEGLVVLDLTRALAGPYGSMVLGDLGAEIIKVEPLEEVDTTRELPPMLGGGVSAYFASVNRNKKALSLNLKSPKGLEIFRALAAQVDVVFDNFRPGTLARLGIDYDALRSHINPGLISCTISGFGSGNPYSERSSFDLVVQAMGGAMSVTGTPGGPPVRLGLPMGDLGAGMYGVIGILAALRARGITGKGRHIEISMLDGMVALLSYMGGHYLQTGEVPGPQGSGHQVNVPYQAFRTKDRWIVIAIFGERFFPEVCEVIGRSELAVDPRFVSAGLRSQNKQAFLDIIEPILLERSADKWLELMLAKRIPCAPINSIDRVLDDPVVRSRQMIIETVHPVYGKAAAPGNPVKVEGIRDGEATPAPVPGEHTEQILTSRLNLGADEIRRLRKEKII